ncbi:MAG: PAS domain S-box protein [Pseudomonadota bacterium]
MNEIHDGNSRVGKKEHQESDPCRAEETLRWEIEASRSIAGLAGALLAPASIDDISHLVLEYAKGLTESPFGFVGYIDPKSGHLVVPTLTRDVWEICRVKDKSHEFEDFGGLWGWVLKNRKSVLANAPADDPRSGGTPEGHITIDRFLSAPALIADRLVGQVAVANSKRDYTEDDLLFVQRLADLYALAIQRVQQEGALRERAMLLNLAHDAIIVFDTEDKIVFWNRGASEVYGRAKEDAVGKVIHELLKTRFPQPLESIEAILNENGEWEGELVQTSRDGRELIVASRWALQRNAEGKPTGILEINRDITGRKQMEQEQRKIAEQYRAIFENSALGIAQSTVEGRLISVNPEFARLFGYDSPAEVLESVSDIAREFYADPTLRDEIVRSVLREDRSLRFEIDFRRKDGSTFTANFHVRPVHGADGTVCGLQSFFEDITDQKQAQKQFERLSRRMELILDSAGEGIFGLDLNGDHTFINPAAAAMLGHEADELIGKPSHAVWHRSKPDGTRYPEEECPIYAAYKDGTVHSGTDEVFWRKDGTSFPVGYTSTPIVENGSLAGAVVVFQDITEQKIAEEALRRSEEQYQELYDSAPDMYFTLSPDGIFTSVNQTGAEHLGYRKQELIGMPFSAIVHADDLERVQEQLARVYSERIARNELDFRKIRKDGSVIWVYEHTRLILDEKGEPLELRIICRDITERKRIEEELYKAQKLESIGILAGGIAHDFNNLLTGILGNVSLAKLGRGLSSESYDIMERVEKAAVQAKRLTGQLLAFARGGSPIRKTLLLSDSIKETVSFALRGSNVQCRLSVPEDLWPVEADEGQIGQVIHNLIINAREAMPDGGMIDISAENELIGQEHAYPLKSGQYVRLSIEDHGIGIKTDELAKIFDPYFTTKQEGRGLGLAVTYSIVKRHNGHIKVDSTVGEGTAFHVYIPASETEVPEKEDETIVANSEGEESARGRKVLLMDDEQLVRNVGKDLLEYFGYKVDLAADGFEAIERYEDAREAGEPFDAVILDLTVPGGMGGKEAIRKLLEIDPHVRGIVSSGYSEDPVMSEYRKYGFKGVIGKPYSLQELAETIRSVIEEKE